MSSFEPCDPVPVDHSLVLSSLLASSYCLLLVLLTFWDKRVKKSLVLSWLLRSRIDLLALVRLERPGSLQQNFSSNKTCESCLPRAV